MTQLAQNIENHDRIVVHVTGIDRPGITSTLMNIIAQESASLVNIGQSVLNGYLTLSALLELDDDSKVLRRLLFAVSRLGLKLEVSALEPFQGRTKENTNPMLCITVIGELSSGVVLSALTGALAAREMNIRDIITLSDQGLHGIELIVELPAQKTLTDEEFSQLRGEILSLAMEYGVDMAVQKDDIFRRNKRMICLDVDSTFVQAELIDELAEIAGCKDQVAAITHRAMNGELDFKQALRERVKLLEGVTMAQAMKLTESVKLTPGADMFVGTLKRLGYQVGLISGGFDFFVDHLKETLGLDFAFANELEVINGVLTGRVKGTIVDAERKAQVLRDMAKVYKCRIEQTIAVGDGANDMFMLQAAGLGIAFRGKPKLQAVADMSLNHHERLDTLLYLMGFKLSDIRALWSRKPT